MDRSKELYAFLKELAIPYQLYHHKKDISIDEFFDTMPLDWSQTTLCKNVFLCNRQQTQHFLMLLPRLRPYRTAVVSKLLGVSRLSFAPQESLPVFLGCDSGAVSPLGLMFDTHRRVQLVLDQELLKLPRLLFHPCVSHSTLEIRTADFLRRFLPACGHEPIALDLPKE